MSVQPYKQKDRGCKGEGHPIMFGFKEAEHFDPFPDGGGYPKRFLKLAYERMGVTNPARVLHVCSGSMRSGVTVDIRQSRNPSVVANGIHLPFFDDYFRWVLVDPPYSREYAENLYGTGAVYPAPGTLLREAIRVCRIGGFVGFMHFCVPKFQRPAKLLAVYGITQGPGYNIRAWSLFTKLRRQTCPTK